MGVMNARVSGSWVPIGSGGINSLGGSGIIKVDVSNPGTPVISTQAGTTPGPLTIAGQPANAGGSNLILQAQSASEGGQIQFLAGDGATTWQLDTTNNSIRIWGGTGGGVRMEIAVGGRATFSNGVTVNNADLQIGGAYGLAWPTYGGAIYMNDTTWMRTNDKGLYVGGAWLGAGGLSISNNGVIQGGFVADFNGAMYTGQITTRTGSGIQVNGTKTNVYYDAGVLNQNGGASRSNFAVHPGGVAYIMGTETNGGSINFLNSTSDGYCNIWCWSVSQASRRASKQDIKSWPPLGAGAGTLTAAERLRLIDVYHFRQKREQALHQIEHERRERAWGRLNAYRERIGLPPRPHLLHDCDEHDCVGTGADPCARIREWDNPQIGVMIEDLVNVLPEVVAIDDDGEPGGVRTNSMLGYLLAVCKEQQERIEALEGSGQQHHHQQEAA